MAIDKFGTGAKSEEYLQIQNTVKPFSSPVYLNEEGNQFYNLNGVMQEYVPQIQDVFNAAPDTNNVTE